MKIKEILKSPNFKKIAAAGLMLLIADTFFIISIKSLWTRNINLAREVKDETLKLKNDPDKLDPEDSLTPQIQKLRSELSSIEGNFFSDGGDILAYLNQLTKDSQIKFKGIYPSEAIPLEIPGITAEKGPKQPQKTQKKSEPANKKEAKGKKPQVEPPPQKPKSRENPALTQLPVKIMMECDYRQLLQFLDMAENGPKLIMISDIKIESNPQDIWSQNVELFLKIPTIPAVKKQNE